MKRFALCRETKYGCLERISQIKGLANYFPFSLLLPIENSHMIDVDAELSETTNQLCREICQETLQEILSTIVTYWSIVIISTLAYLQLTPFYR